MATNYWIGTTDTDWATTTNWSETATPNADDTIIFDSRQVTKPTTGMTDGGSADDSGHADNATLDLLHFKAGYTGGIGTAALPLCCAPDKIIIDGTGTYYINCATTDQSTDATIPLVIINNKSAIVYLFSNANDAGNICEFTDVYVIAGTLYVSYYDADTDDQGCSIANLYLAPKSGKSGDITVVIEKDAYDVKNSTAMNIYMDGGTLSTDSQVGTFHVNSGTVYYGSEPNLGTAVAETDMNITLLKMWGGTFNWEPDDSGDDAYIANAFIFGGTLDASGTTSNDRTKVLCPGATNRLYLFDGATLNLKNGRGNITVTANKLINFGGTIITDSHTLMDVTYNTP